MYPLIEKLEINHILHYPNVKPGSLQFGSDAAAYFDSDTVLILPFPKELSMELKY